MNSAIQTAEDFVRMFLPQQVQQVAGELRGRSLNGSFGLNVIGSGAWSISLQDGALVLVDGLTPNRILTVSLSQTDFKDLVLVGLNNGNLGAGLSLRFARWDDETSDLLRALEGSALLEVADGERSLHVVISPGTRPIDFKSTACTISCALDDLKLARAGKAEPMELFMAGKIRLTGDANLALALAGSLL